MVPFDMYMCMYLWNPESEWISFHWLILNPKFDCNPVPFFCLIISSFSSVNVEKDYY